MLSWWHPQCGCEHRLVQPSKWSRQKATYEYDLLHLLVSLFQSVKHGAAVSGSPYLFLSPKRLGAGVLSIYRNLPTCSDSRPPETVPHHPSPSFNSCSSPLQICLLQCLCNVCAMSITIPTVKLMLFQRTGESGEHHTILGLQEFLNNMAEKPVIYGLWICNFIRKVTHTKYSMEYSDNTYDNWSFSW